MKKKNKDRHANKNQRSFYFEDYIHSNRDLKKNKKNFIIEDRVYILFFSFLALISIFSLKILSISSSLIAEIFQVDNKSDKDSNTYSLGSSMSVYNPGVAFSSSCNSIEAPIAATPPKEYPKR